MALSPKVFARVEENMRVTQEQVYATAASNRWSDKFLKDVPSTASAEHFYQLFTGGAMDYATEGQREFLEQAIKRLDVTPKFFSVPGLEVLRSELDDSDGAGFAKAEQWTADTTMKGALFAQQQLAKALIANPTCIDGLPFFSNAHPLLPGDPSSAVWANDLTGSAAGAPGADFPGAVPLVDNAATDNATLGKVLAYIRGIKGPDGTTCLNLEPVSFLSGPSLYRIGLSAAKAQFVGGTAGSTDVSMQVNDFGLDMVRAGELATDLSYYIGCRQVGTQLGAWGWLNRESPNIGYYGPMNSSELMRMDKFQWGVRGRGVVFPGRPHFFFRCKPN